MARRDFSRTVPETFATAQYVLNERELADMGMGLTRLDGRPDARWRPVAVAETTTAFKEIQKPFWEA